VTASVTDVITGLTKYECPGWKIINDNLAWDIFPNTAASAAEGTPSNGAFFLDLIPSSRIEETNAGVILREGKARRGVGDGD
jgi:hypothetical protein